MAIAVLLRHGRTTANADGLLAGRSLGTALDDEGTRQAVAAAQRIAVLPVHRVVSSPLRRCRQTATEVVRGQQAARQVSLRVRTDQRLTECDYGEWTGQKLKALARTPLWRAVQAHPSGVRFPGGESMVGMQARAVAAVRAIDADVEAEVGPDGIWVGVSHGDVIKAVLAEALGMHLDQFQRVVVEPGSVSVVRFTPLRPFVVHLNDHGSDLSPLRPHKRGRRRAASDAAVGG
ncbi:MAG: MSMEG_4193 family putative phosphomutase, partial [Actinomycetota bacterium]|nr:MSMEG_4193 family putative phosphomutase [Actinomycetota bacterium]